VLSASRPSTSSSAPYLFSYGSIASLDRKPLARCHERFLAEGAFPAGNGGQSYGDMIRKV
jgi:hypothetical protein